MRVRLLLCVGAAARRQPSRRPLASGGRNPQVAGLQVALRAQGLYHGAIDAIAGPLTIAAVRDVPARAPSPRHRASPTRRTRAALGPLGRPLFGTRLAPARRVRLGRRRAPVPARPPRDRRPVNGYFDGPTLRGVRRFQRRRTSPPTGSSGRRRFAAIARRSRRSAGRSQRTPARPHPRRAARRVAHRDREALPHDGREARAAQPPRPTRLPPDRHEAARPRAQRGRPSRRTRSRAREHRVRPRAPRPLGGALRRRPVISSARSRGWSPGYNNRLVSSAGARGIMQIDAVRRGDSSRPC